MTDLHTPVMLEEVTQYLVPEPGKTFIDATLGFGGHTLALLAAGSSVVGIDRDADMLEMATSRIVEAGYTDRFTPMHSSFADALGSDRLPKNHYDGVLFDLGVSSYQLDTAERGFSFRYDAPLDMRMDKASPVTAKDLLNGLGKKELAELFTTLGEIPQAARLSQAICAARKSAPITTTGELAKIVESVIPRSGKIHPATKVFQALRMAVNSERAELKAALPSALSLLMENGVLAVISFHSLEDRLVKEFFADNPGIVSLAKKPLEPSVSEIQTNPRARSAKLRVGRKVTL